MGESKTIEQVIAEFVIACEQGSAGDPQDWISRYPEYAAELRDFIETHSQFESVSEQWSPTAASKPPDSAALDSQLSLGEKVSRSELPTRPPRMKPEGVDAAKHKDDIGRNKQSSWIASAADVAGTSSELRDSVSGSWIPKRIGNYRVLEEIDRGGMGIVFKARDEKLNRVVALKLIRSGELASEEEVQRFISEAEAAAALTHPGIVPIYEVGALNGLVFYTMAYIEGRSLAAMVDHNGLDPNEAIQLVRKLCDAVQYAHNHGVLHRDLKPANVIVNAAGQPIIIDFGLAKVVSSDQSLTATGQLLGTPGYMAPEHASGKVRQVGPGADVYALGAILYFLCAGQAAFSGATPFDVLLQVLDRRPPRPSKLNKRVNSDLDAVCLRMLEKEPQLRHASAELLAEDLERLLRGEPIEAFADSATEKWRKWWQREPILAAHVLGIGITTSIVVLAYLARSEHAPEFYYRLGLLLIWISASYFLQMWVDFTRWTNLAVYSWLVVDVVIYTTLIAFASEPRSMLLIGYPMMVVASGLYYQRRFTVTTTVLAITGFLVLGILFPKEDFQKWDNAAIFVAGLTVICLCLISVINRVRGLSRFYEH